MPHASGGFTDVRQGEFKGEGVAVKSLRVAELNHKVSTRKVGHRFTVSHPGSLTHRTVVLQRGCHVEELVPS